MHGRHRQPVARDADEAHDPFLARLERRLERSAGAQRHLPVDGVDQVVQLDQVDVVDAEAVQRAADLLARALVVAPAGLGRDEREVLRMAAQPGGDAQLRVAVVGGDVQVVDAVLDQLAQRAVGVALGDGGERRAAEDHAAGLVPGGAERRALDHALERTRSSAPMAARRRSVSSVATSTAPGYRGRPNAIVVRARRSRPRPLGIARPLPPTWTGTTGTPVVSDSSATPER